MRRVLFFLLTFSDYCDSIDYSNSTKRAYDMRLFDSEIKVMEIVWDNEPVSAKDISVIAEKEIGWNKNTTYTVLKKLVDKEYIKRTDPNFICTSIVSRSMARREETDGLINRLFGGSKKALFSALISDGISEEEKAELRLLIDKG